VFDVDPFRSTTFMSFAECVVLIVVKFNPFIRCNPGFQIQLNKSAGRITQILRLVKVKYGGLSQGLP
jgi:hypothetical protein